MQEFKVHTSIPVIRMLEESKPRHFYLDYLGYSVAWEHRFQDSESSPLYMQVSFEGSVLHLNGHASQDDPVAEVRIPVSL